MSVYQRVLALAREQVAAISCGDLATAIRLLEDRSTLLDGAPAPVQSERGDVAEILRLDRTIAGALREGMLKAREEVVALHRGADALVSYQAQPSNRAGAHDWCV